jgi:hypothetical protein
MPSPSVLWQAFRDGVGLQAGSVAVTMACQEMGAITLPTGRIVACDPFTEIHTRGFRRTVDPDSYATFIAIADYGHDQRIAAAMILFAVETHPLYWELAVDANGGPLESPGFLVDSGLGCFMDLKLTRYLFRQAENRRLGRYQRQIDTQLDEHARPTWSWANTAIATSSRANMIAFTTGMGDGTYASYFGLDGSGRPVCLISDFRLLD